MLPHSVPTIRSGLSACFGAALTACLAVALLATAARPAAADAGPCVEPAGMTADLEGDDILVSHLNATYNCCMRAEYALSVDGQRLVLDETEVLIVGGCDCICCYQLAARIADVPPGSWLVVLRGAGFEFTQPVVVPGGTAGGLASARAAGPRLGGFGQSRCGGSDIVGVDEPETTWGALKSAYR